jgi:RNA polymerase sigma-70 factor (ECF subfamily)
MVRGPSPFSRQSTVLADMPTKREPNKPPSTHLTLLARLRGSASAEAWATFVDLYTPLIYQFCRSRFLQDADARDVTQQVLAIMHQAIPQFQYDPERGRFRDWLGTTTLHEISRHQRKARRAGQGVGGGEDLVERTQATADPAWIEEFNAYMFQLALERIRPSFDDETWRAFELTWLNDVKPQVAAEQLGRKTGWVYKARFKVLQQLRREIEFLTSDSAMIQRPS